jgi:hypothetical protein
MNNLDPGRTGVPLGLLLECMRYRVDRAPLTCLGTEWMDNKLARLIDEAPVHFLGMQAVRLSDAGICCLAHQWNCFESDTNRRHGL